MSGPVINDRRIWCIDGFREWRVMSDVNGHRKADALDAENGMGRGSIGRENRRYLVKIGRHSHSQSTRSVNPTGLNASRFRKTFGWFALEKCRLRVVTRGRRVPVLQSCNYEISSRHSGGGVVTPTVQNSKRHFTREFEQPLSETESSLVSCACTVGCRRASNRPPR